VKFLNFYQMTENLKMNDFFGFKWERLIIHCLFLSITLHLYIHLFHLNLVRMIYFLQYHLNFYNHFHFTNLLFVPNLHIFLQSMKD